MMNRKEMLKKLRHGEDPLEVTIQKWQDIVDGKGIDEYRDNCALCEVHRQSWEEERKQSTSVACGKCPVKLKTGQPFCRKSPWTQTVSTSKSSAKLVLDFLKSLRKSP